MEASDEFLKSVPSFSGKSGLWPAFERKLRFYLKARGLYYILDSAPVQPGASATTSAEAASSSPKGKKTATAAVSDLAAEERRKLDDAKVQYILISKCDDRLTSLIENKTTAREMFDTLKAQFDNELAATSMF